MVTFQEGVNLSVMLEMINKTPARKKMDKKQRLADFILKNTGIKIRRMVKIHRKGVG
jgi:hypothetical protein